MIVLALVLLGISLGSFVNAAVWRLHEQEILREGVDSNKKKSRKKDTKTVGLRAEDLSIVRGRSMCSHCHHVLAAKDLIPVLSWLWLKGKCRYCHGPIQDTPFTELCAPVLFVVSYCFWPQPFHGFGLVTFIFWLVFLTAFVALTLYDIRWFLLPDRIIFPLMTLALLQVMVQAMFFEGGWRTLLEAGWGVLVLAGLFYMLFAVSRGAWIGFGDVKLAVVLGLLVGGPLRALLVIFLASSLGSLVAMPLLIKGKAKPMTRLPFGPFLLSAAVVLVLFGDRITGWYSFLLN